MEQNYYNNNDKAYFVRKIKTILYKIIIEIDGNLVLEPIKTNKDCAKIIIKASPTIIIIKKEITEKENNEFKLSLSPLTIYFAISGCFTVKKL